jgi:phosphoglycolate phosphatase-like HAD superfamily hydrolase
VAGSRAVLLDLDGTLVISEALEPLRRARRWQEVYSQLAKTRLPPGTAEFVTWARRVGSCGVVTTAPRPYAERLLAHHGLALPVLVAFHDVGQRKPDPAPLLRGAGILEIDPARCVHVGDLPTDDEAAQRAGMASVLVSWDQSTPDACASWSDVADAIVGAFGRAEWDPMPRFQPSSP